MNFSFQRSLDFITNGGLNDSVSSRHRKCSLNPATFCPQSPKVGFYSNIPPTFCCRPSHFLIGVVAPFFLTLLYSASPIGSH